VRENVPASLVTRPSGRTVSISSRTLGNPAKSVKAEIDAARRIGGSNQPA
jgi:hypothetical protein